MRTKKLKKPLETDRTGIARWDGSDWNALGSALSGAVETLAIYGSDLYVGGTFGFAGEVAVRNVAKWNGSGWSALGAGTNGTVYAIAVSGSDVYVGGSFSLAGGVVNTSRISRWDGSAWNALGMGLSNTVFALKVSGSDVYVGGAFSDAGGILQADRIARWDGTTWNALGTGVNSTVETIEVSGGDVYVGGTFSSAGGVANTSYIARWDGSVWNALSAGTDGPVTAIAVSGSDVYVGGSFSSAGGVSYTDSVARWDGASWHALGLGGGIGGVSALAATSSNVFVAGSFSSIGGISANRIAMWNGSAWLPLGSGFSNSVTSLALTGNDLYVGGYFSLGPPNGSPYLVQANVSSINRYPLEISYAGAGTGTVDVSPAGVDFFPGTMVTLTANPDPGSAFVGWGGDIQSYDNPITITMDSYVAINAQFGTTLSIALDGAGIDFTTGGDLDWFGQSNQTYDGVDALQSGPIGNNQETWFESTIEGPGTLSFWWKVSSEAGYDFLEFYIDGVRQDGRISGETGWEQQTFTIFTGTHTVRWRYAKDKSSASGSDAGWVDNIKWSPDGLAMPHVLDQYNIPFTRGGDNPWLGQAALSHDGLDAARSGAIHDDEESLLHASVIGPGTISFWWKVSSEAGYDFLEFYVNGTLKPGRISGDSGWVQQTFVLLDGIHNLTWRYAKDRNTTAGADAGWVDEVEWETSASSSFEAWQTAYFSASELADLLVSGPNVDADGDGLVNLLEFALNGNPKQNGSAPTPQFSLSGASEPQLSFSCNSSRIGVTYVVQASSNLSTWTDIATSVDGGPMVADGGLSTVTDTGVGVRQVTVTYAGTTGSSVYMRLVVTQN
jgi:hypothetical protein